MNIKLDENLGNRGADLFRNAGHDVATVQGQELCSAPDPQVIETCRAEQRCLVTLDLDFGNPLLFRPSSFPGIAVIRLPHKGTPDLLFRAVETLLKCLSHGNIRGKLWIVEPTRVREYQPDEESE